ncbi:MAG: hypothetical protein B7Y02_00660 [Rhodobacterales bacterium 17-64-5]|nr:MAG: hypothetical protein B7Y02_00660 [Rhodobacterales bacterium 17-64-5]
MGAVLAMKNYMLVASICLLSGCLPIVDKLAGQPAPERVSLSAEALAGPFLLVQIPSRNVSATLARIAVNADVETWITADNVSLSFRQGILVASRGLGFDLMGADATGTLAALSGSEAGIYRHQMRYLTGDNHNTYLMAGCQMQNKGSEVRSGQTLHRLEESCVARDNDFTNVFWVDANGRILQSRQWVAPEIGYIDVSLQAKRPAPDK